MNLHSPIRILILCIIISILIHLSFILFIPHDLSKKNSTDEKKEKVTWTRLAPIKSPKNQPKQIADIKKPIKEEKPSQAQTYAKYDQKVDPKDETVAPQSGESLNSDSKNQAPKEKIPEQPIIPQGFSNLNPEPQKYSKYNLPQPKYGDEYLSGYKIGNRTYINAEANQHIFYFVELKRKFKLAWNPLQAIRRDPSIRNLRKAIAVIGVSINAQGNLIGLITIKSSGNAIYDEEAKRTIRTSAPFTPPDQEVLDQDGVLHSAWHFIATM